jgi:hypothetical protein
MNSTKITFRMKASDLPLASLASSEVRRLRTVRVELEQRRTEIDRELKAVDTLIATYVSYQPELDDGASLRHGRARNLGATLAKILTERSDEWLALNDLAASAGRLLPGIDMTDTRLRNALYHLVKTGRIESTQTDSGIQYRCFKQD